jgi:hypothetical protein
MLINRELSRSFIAQHTSKNIHLFLTKAEFEYLKVRLLPVVIIHRKNGLSTNILPRKCAAQESIKQRAKKSTFEWTQQKNSRDYNLSLVVQVLLVLVGVHLLFLLFVLLTNTNGALLLLDDMTR